MYYDKKSGAYYHEYEVPRSPRWCNSYNSWEACSTNDRILKYLNTLLDPESCEKLLLIPRRGISPYSPEALFDSDYTYEFEHPLVHVAQLEEKVQFPPFKQPEGQKEYFDLILDFIKFLLVRPYQQVLPNFIRPIQHFLNPVVRSEGNVIWPADEDLAREDIMDRKAKKAKTQALLDPNLMLRLELTSHQLRQAKQELLEIKQEINSSSDPNNLPFPDLSDLAEREFENFFNNLPINSVTDEQAYSIPLVYPVGKEPSLEQRKKHYACIQYLFCDQDCKFGVAQSPATEPMEAEDQKPAAKDNVDQDFDPSGVD